MDFFPHTSVRAAKKVAELWVPGVGWQQILRRAENLLRDTGMQPGSSEGTGPF